MLSNYFLTAQLMIFPLDICVCGEIFTVDHAMICKRGGFVIQQHNELRDLEADVLRLNSNPSSKRTAQQRS